MKWVKKPWMKTWMAMSFPGLAHKRKHKRQRLGEETTEDGGRKKVYMGGWGLHKYSRTSELRTPQLRNTRSTRHSKFL